MSAGSVRTCPSVAEGRSNGPAPGLNNPATDPSRVWLARTQAHRKPTPRGVRQGSLPRAAESPLVRRRTAGGSGLAGALVREQHALFQMRANQASMDQDIEKDELTDDREAL